MEVFFGEKEEGKSRKQKAESRNRKTRFGLDNDQTWAVKGRLGLGGDTGGLPKSQWDRVGCTRAKQRRYTGGLPEIYRRFTGDIPEVYRRYAGTSPSQHPPTTPTSLACPDGRDVGCGGKRSATPLFLTNAIPRCIQPSHAQPKRRRASLAAAVQRAFLTRQPSDQGSLADWGDWGNRREPPLRVRVRLEEV